MSASALPIMLRMIQFVIIGKSKNFYLFVWLALLEWTKTIDIIGNISSSDSVKQMHLLKCCGNISNTKK